MTRCQPLLRFYPHFPRLATDDYQMRHDAGNVFPDVDGQQVKAMQNGKPTVAMGRRRDGVTGKAPSNCASSRTWPSRRIPRPTPTTRSPSTGNLDRGSDRLGLVDRLTHHVDATSQGNDYRRNDNKTH
jgi:hypothetical protein